jgi:hypothetical protein
LSAKNNIYLIEQEKNVDLMGENKTETIFHKVYDVLVKECGAYGKDHARQAFIHAFCYSEYPCNEFRFQGIFGFGGKFWHSSRKFYVNCYSEDSTAKIQKAIDTTNELLKPLYEEYVIVSGIK